MFISESILVDTLLGIATLLGLLYFYLTSTFNYWKKKGVPYVKPTIIFGNLKEQFFLQRHLFYVIQDIYNNFNGARFGGYFESRTPVLMICDPALVERILIKDFLYFQNRDFAVDVKQDPLSETLFGLKGRTWRNLRNKLTPTFTTGKLRGMVEQICNSGDDLMNEIEKSTEQKKPVDAKKLGIGFTIDVIASCAFGLQFKLDHT
ncbi:LOW QUALITY PROTEIN: cytochrome P450 6j1-like [Homalodisca vitripennis]|uniref:LOW QUALITY PROTEIN: cytochrome P450 6j1-like n=1 Tax=Homalodisca vitripennis TaxID=197043 RepID=UPI001EEA0F3B|nr:LOW QUALITY PROTEIN: cytochrome P450 6j1-like [Homalodisca vitripennis]